MKRLLAIVFIVPYLTWAQTSGDKLFEKAQEYKEQAAYDSAIFYYEKASVAYKSDQSVVKELEALNQKAFLLSIQGMYQEGIEILNQTLARGLKIKNGTNLPLASSYHILGVAQYVGGNYEEALKNTQKGYEMRTKLYDGAHEDIAKSLNNMGILYETMGNLNKGLEVYKKAYDIQVALYGEKHVEVANSINNLGANAYYRAEYSRALELYNQALELYIELLGNRHKDVASVYLNIGAIYNEQSEFQKSLDYTLQAKNIYAELYGTKDFNYLNVALSLTSIYKELQKPKVALEYGLEGYELALLFYGDQHPAVGGLAQNIGVIYEDLGQIDKAIEWQEKSMVINKVTQGERSLSVAYNYNNLGTAYKILQDYKKSEEYLLKAIDIKREQLGSKHASIALSLISLATVHVESGAFRKAVQAAHSSILANSFSFSDSSLLAIPELKNYSDPETLLQSLIIKSAAMIKLYLASEELQWLNAASEHVAKGQELLTSFQMTVNAEDKIHLAEESHNLASVGLVAERLLYEQTENTEHLKVAFEYVEQTKGAILNASIEDANAREFAGIPEQLLNQEQLLSNELQNYKQELALSLNSGASEEQIAHIRDSLFRLNKRYELLIKQFESNYPRYFDLKYNLETVGVSQIQETYLANKPETTVVEFFETDSAFVAFVITQNSLALVELPVWDYTRNIRGLRNAIIFKVDDRIPELAHAVYMNLFKPIDDLIKAKADIKEIVVIPDGILGYLPFEVLIKEEAGDLRFHKQEYLVKDYAIKYAVSSTLMYKQFISPPNYGDKDYVAFAPVFSDGSETNFVVNTSERFYQPGLDNTRNFVRDGKVTPIPSTKDEVEEIHGLHQKKNLFAKYFLFKDAKESNLKDAELSHYKFIHLATHGFVNDEIPELSGLVMSQAADSTEDGILYVGEIYNLDWNADMVALSACETGLGKVVKGEGIIGLTRAFMYAGAENVLVSLWKVSDKSTSDLMIDFYNHLLEGQAKSQAMRKAKLRLIKSKVYANPYYWAPFVLIGN